MTSKLEKGPPGSLYESPDDSIVELADTAELLPEDREFMERLEKRIADARSEREPSSK